MHFFYIIRWDNKSAKIATFIYMQFCFGLTKCDATRFRPFAIFTLEKRNTTALQKNRTFALVLTFHPQKNATQLRSEKYRCWPFYPPHVQIVILLIYNLKKKKKKLWREKGAHGPSCPPNYNTGINYMNYWSKILI